MTDRYKEWRDFYTEKVRSWMSLEELRAECGELTTTDAPSPELLLIHAMHALEEYVQPQQPAMRVHDLAALLVDELDGLVGESDGVSGLHLNGDVATWDELLPGGRFERLSSLDELRAALAQQPAAAMTTEIELLPLPVPASDTLVLGSATATSYGPRVEPYNDGNIEPAKRAEDAEFWSVYEWWPSRHAPKGGWWEWRADCDTEDIARALAEAIAGVAQQPAAVNDGMVDRAEENLAAHRKEQA